MKPIKTTLILALVGSAALIAGCNTKFGMDPEDFDKLNPHQQQQVINAYNQREAARQYAENEKMLEAERNRPLNNLIGTLATAIPTKTESKEKCWYDDNGTRHCRGSSFSVGPRR